MNLKPLKALTALKPLNPIKVESTLGEPQGNPEEAALTDHQKMMRQLREQQAKANETANDSAYWFAVYFQTQQQRDEYIAALKLTTGGQYVDGLELAKKCGVPITPRTAKYKTGVIDKKCAELAR